MSKKISLQIRLPKKIIEEIDKAIAKGFYSSRSDYIQEQVRKSILEKLEKEVKRKNK